MKKTHYLLAALTLGMASMPKVQAQTTWQPTAVDLGLSVLWADCNVGAKSPYQAGDFFAWAEVQPKDDYQRSTYFDYDYQYSTTTGNDCYAGDPQYDAATANWGDGWYTPTSAEIEELIDKCTWRSTRKQGVSGYLVTGPSGQSIFLPAAGNRFETALYGEGAYGFYWSSDAVVTDETAEAAASLTFNGTLYYSSNSYRHNGHTVRPVKQDDGTGTAIRTIQTDSAERAYDASQTVARGLYIVSRGGKTLKIYKKH